MPHSLRRQRQPRRVKSIRAPRQPLERERIELEPLEVSKRFLPSFEEQYEAELEARAMPPDQMPGAATILERVVYKALWDLGYRPPDMDFQSSMLGGRLDWGFGRQVADFAIHSLGIVIEVQGQFWHQYGDQEQRDMEREVRLRLVPRQVPWLVYFLEEPVIRDRYRLHQWLLEHVIHAGLRREDRALPPPPPPWYGREELMPLWDLPQTGNDWSMRSPVNYLINGGFEADATYPIGWTTQANATATIVSGKLRINASSADNGVYQEVTGLKPDAIYTIVCQVNTGGNEARIYTTGSEHNADETVKTASEKQWSALCRASDTGTLTLYLTAHTTGVNIDFDDVSLFRGHLVFPFVPNPLDAWRHPSDSVLIDGGDIYAASITADKFAVIGTPGGARVQITPTGIEGYKAGPTQTFDFATDGSFWFGAASGSGSLVYNGTTFTLQGLAQTWVDGSGNTRGMVDPKAGEVGHDYLFWLGPSSGDKRFAVDDEGVVYIGSVPSQNVAGWAHASDLTKIDGGDIYAHSVTAEKINVFGLNLVGNPGLETGDFTEWSGGIFASVQSGTVHSGKYAVARTGTTGAVTVAYQDRKIEPGRNYYAGVWVANSSGTGSAGCFVQWFDADGSSIDIKYMLSAASTTWSKKGAVVTAPATAASARFGIGIDAGNTVEVYFDDAEFYIADAALTVGNTDGARVQITADGIQGYDTTPDLQFYLRTEDGRAMFGNGHGVLDSTGAVLDGNATEYEDYSALRWQSVVDPPGGYRVAYISAGRLYGSTEPQLDIKVNPDSTWDRAQLFITSKSGSSGTWSHITLASDFDDVPPVTADVSSIYMRSYAQLEAELSWLYLVGYAGTKSYISLGSTGYVDIYAGGPSYKALRLEKLATTFITNGTERWRITGSNTAALPSLVPQGDTDTGIYQSAADKLDFATGGTNRLNISSAGLTLAGSLLGTTVIGASVYRSSTQTHNNTGNWVTVAFGDEYWDTDSIHDNATNNTRLTCKTAGVYEIAACLRFAANSTGERGLRFVAGGATAIGWVMVPTAPTQPAVLNLVWRHSMAVNDYVELQAYQNSGGNLDMVYADGYSINFSMVRIA